MLGKLVLVCLIVSAVAINNHRQQHRASKAKDTSKWDIYGSGPLNLKDRRHENFASEAIALLRTDVGSSDAGTFFDLKTLEEGTMWNDMPCDEDYPTYLNLATWLADYKLAHKPNIVQASHFGCVMHWHGMQSEFDPRTVAGQNIKTVWFTNANVKKQIYQIAEYWWGRAVADRATDKKYASFRLGHLAHLLMDSQAEGHLVRGWKTTATVPAFNFGDQRSPTACPPIVYYMGYIAENGNGAHADADHDPFNPVHRSEPANGRRKILAHCARAYTYRLFKAFYTCAKTGAHCDYATGLKPILDHEFAWADASFATRKAAGATTDFIGPAAKANGFKMDSNYKYKDPTGATKADIYLPTGTNTATTPDWDAMKTNPQLKDVGLCTELQARSGALRASTKKFTNYFNPTPANSAGPDSELLVRSSSTVAIGSVTTSS